MNEEAGMSREKRYRLFGAGLRAHILMALIGTTLVALIAFAVVSLHGMNSLKTHTVGTSIGFGKDAVDISKDALEKMARHALLMATVDQTELAKAEFDRIEASVNTIAGFIEAGWGAKDRDVEERIHDAQNPPKDPRLNSLISFAPKADRKAADADIKRTADLDSLAGPMMANDSHMEGVQLGMASGLFRRLPWTGDLPPDYDPRDRSWYKEAVAKGALMWSSPYVSAIVKEPRMNCAKPLHVDGKLIGVVGVIVPLKSISERIIGAKMHEKGGQALLINKTMQVIARKGLERDPMGEPVKEFFSVDGGEGGTLANMKRDLANGQAGIVRAGYKGQDSFIGYAPIANTQWAVVMALPYDIVVSPIKPTEMAIAAQSASAIQKMASIFSMTLVQLLAVFAILVLAVVFVGQRVADKVVAPILTLNAGTKLLGGGNLDHRLVVRTGNEIEELADAFNKMAQDLKIYVSNLKETTAAKERIESELQIAHKIQTSILPRIFPPFPDRKEIDLHASMVPAREVGGDFFDFFMIDDNRLCLVIGDVSDKGIPAAIFMAVTKTLIKTEALQPGHTAADVLSRVNNQLCQENEMLMFVTVFCVIVDVRTGECEFANAGHNPPVICRCGTKAAFMNPGKGVALAVMEDAPFNLGRDKIRPGDVLFIYTDGINEAMNTAHEQFSYDRLLSGVESNKAGGMKDLIDRMAELVKTFAGEAPQSDDVTMVALRFFGPPGTDGKDAK